MNVKSLIIQPYKIASIIGAAVRFQSDNGETKDLFFSPELVNFLVQQFVIIDRRFNVEADEAKFGGRIAEFVGARERIGLPEIGPNQYVKDLGVDETNLPIILTAIGTAGTPFQFNFDEVAVHGLVAELADVSLAFAAVQGQG